MVNQPNTILRGVYFAPARTCNLSCSYCYLEEKKNKYKDEDVVNGFKEFVGMLITNNNPPLPYIAFIGAEASILPPESYLEMFDYYESKYGKNKTQFALQTNGIDIKKHLDMFGIHNTRIGTSLDMSKENNDLHRGIGSYDKVIDNIKYAKAKGFDVTVQSVIQPSHLFDKQPVLDFINLSKELGFAVILKPLSSDEISLNIDEAVTFGEWLVESGYYIYYQTFFSSGMCNTRGNHCYYYQFDPLGGVYSCNVAFGPSGRFADWKKEHINDIDVKRRMLYTKVPTNPECDKCHAKIICNGGCPLERHRGYAADCFIRKGCMNAIIKHGMNLHSMFKASWDYRMSVYNNFIGA